MIIDIHLIFLCSKVNRKISVFSSWKKFGKSIKILLNIKIIDLNLSEQYLHLIIFRLVPLKLWYFQSFSLFVLGLVKNKNFCFRSKEVESFSDAPWKTMVIGKCWGHLEQQWTKIWNFDALTLKFDQNDLKKKWKSTPISFGQFCSKWPSKFAFHPNDLLTIFGTLNGRRL